ncbi:MAG: alpha/beta hydrolase [Oscillospiraceae bacterium]|nr:alpha/beta hydrolase [Oscillospiraceae bacterium]
MRYQNQIHPELRRIARRVPYNRAVIRCANLFLAAALRLTRVPADVTRAQITLAGSGLPFRTEIFTPADAAGALPCLLYLHGGAFSYRASVHHKKLACLYAAQARCKVFFPDYHLAPKHPYPAAYQDALALYRHLTAHAGALGIDPEKIGVGGDSAGAALAALVTNRCEQEALPLPCLQMLVYPVTDAAMETASMQKYTDTPLWNAKSTRRMWRCYGGGLDASPMHDRLPRCIPDTYLETAEFDCLRDEGALYGEKLRAAGARVTRNDTRGTFHGYDAALGTSVAAESIRRRVSFLRQAFGGAKFVDSGEKAW